MHRILLAAAATATMATTALAADLPKVVADKRPAPAAVAEPIAKLLAPQSYTVSAGDKAIAHFWVRSAIPATAAKDGIPYGNIEEGTVVGVVEIKSDDLTDYRKQPLNKGVFTLRMGLQPRDGNHMGTAPSPEFLCLVQAAADKSDDPIEHKDLMKLSKKAAGTGHPAVLFLQPYSDNPTLKFPVVNANKSGHAVLNLLAAAQLKGDRKAELPIGIVIIGHTSAE